MVGYLKKRTSEFSRKLENIYICHDRTVTRSVLVLSVGREEISSF